MPLLKWTPGGQKSLLNLFEFKSTAKTHREQNSQHHFQHSFLKVISSCIFRYRRYCIMESSDYFGILLKMQAFQEIPSPPPTLSWVIMPITNPVSKSENYWNANWTEPLSVTENISVLIEPRWWDLNKPGMSSTQFTMVLFNHRPCTAWKLWVKRQWEMEWWMRDDMECALLKRKRAMGAAH